MIVETSVYEKSWQSERFLVNGKYVIVEKADLIREGGKRVVIMDIMVRELLTRPDLAAFKKKIQTDFGKDLIIRVRPIYIP